MAETMKTKRIGFHYFNDTLHYRESDLQAWLPQLKSMGASWIVLKSESQRAIPEAFVRGMVKNGIQPIIHMPLSLSAPTSPLELSPLFKAYANWGVKHLVLFDKPNVHESWDNTLWAQQKSMVDRFLEIYIPLALQVMQDGLQPGLPPLKRGGDYWDTAFLRATLQEIKQRNLSDLLDKLFISANATTQGHALAWGAGGPERWPGARPHFTQPGEEDQQGFYVFDWYTAISEAILERKLPITLLKSGSTATDPAQHTTESLEIAQMLTHPDSGSNPIADHIFSANFWVLAEANESTTENAGWYQANATIRDAVKALKTLHLSNEPKKQENKKTTHLFVNKPTEEPLGTNLGEVPTPNPASANTTPLTEQLHVSEKSLAEAVTGETKNNGYSKILNHYLLLPLYEWGPADWHLEVIQPFIKKHQATAGYSIDEARHARLVTVVGGEQSFSPEIIERLQLSGCQIQQIQGTGTSIATQLATL